MKGKKVEWLKGTVVDYIHQRSLKGQFYELKLNMAVDVNRVLVIVHKTRKVLVEDLMKLARSDGKVLAIDSAGREMMLLLHNYVTPCVSLKTTPYPYKIGNAAPNANPLTG